MISHTIRHIQPPRWGCAVTRPRLGFAKTRGPSLIGSTSLGSPYVAAVSRVINSRGRSHRLNREPLDNDLPRSLLGSPRPSANVPSRISAHAPSGTDSSGRGSQTRSPLSARGTLRVVQEPAPPQTAPTAAPQLRCSLELAMLVGSIGAQKRWRGSPFLSSEWGDTPPLININVTTAQQRTQWCPLLRRPLRHSLRPLPGPYLARHPFEGEPLPRAPSLWRRWPFTRPRVPHSVPRSPTVGRYGTARYRRVATMIVDTRRHLAPKSRSRPGPQ